MLNWGLLKCDSGGDYFCVGLDASNKGISSLEIEVDREMFWSRWLCNCCSATCTQRDMHEGGS